MISLVSMDDFVPSRYQLRTFSVTTIAGLNVLCGPDQKRINVKIYPVPIMAIADPAYYFGSFSPTAFRMPLTSGALLELNWYDDSIIVCQRIMVNDAAGGNTFTIAEITQVPSMMESTNVAKRRLAALYQKISGDTINSRRKFSYTRNANNHR